VKSALFQREGFDPDSKKPTGVGWLFRLQINDPL
jgi:hypothetical protein